MGTVIDFQSYSNRKQKETENKEINELLSYLSIEDYNELATMPYDQIKEEINGYLLKADLKRMTENNEAWGSI